MSNKAETTRRIAKEFHKIALGRKDDVSRLVREYLDYEKGRTSAARSVMPDSTKTRHVSHEWETTKGEKRKTESIEIIHPTAAAGEWYENNPYDESKKFCQSVARLVAVTDEYFSSINPGYEKLFNADDDQEEIELACITASLDMRLNDDGFQDVLESEFETVKAAWGIVQPETVAAVDQEEMVASIIEGLRTAEGLASKGTDAAGALPLAPPAPVGQGDTYPQPINSIQIMDSEFRKVRYMGVEYQLSEQARETFRWLFECGAIDVEHGKIKSEIESHLRDKGLIERDNWSVSGMCKGKLKKLGEVLASARLGHKEYCYFIR